jgi:predicted small metal-binding protein
MHVKKSVSCKAMGALDCGFVASGNSAQAVKDIVWAHAAQDHPDVLKSMVPADPAQAHARLEQLLA